VSDKQQKSQMDLASFLEGRSEAPMAKNRGTELPAENRQPEHRVRSTSHLMEEVVSRENLRNALKRVEKNDGKPGPDGIRVSELREVIRKEWPGIQEKLLEGTYRPQPVRRVHIPKPEGGSRKLGIPSATDRLISQAMLQVLQPIFDPTFSDKSYGYRPGRSAHQAVRRVQRYLKEGHRWLVDIDLESFFDRVNHDKLLGKMAKVIEDKRILRVIRAYLVAGIMEGGVSSPSTEGMPQGAPLSPLLSNIMLDELDCELERRGLNFARYADDCNIYVKSERAALRVMEGVSGFIEKTLKLKVNKKKSSVDRPWRRKFLGFSFTAHKDPKRRIAPQSLKRLKKKIREKTRRTRGLDAQSVADDLSVYLRGWIGFFSICQTPSILRDLDSWIRRRLRSLIWAQWKRGRTRFRKLRELGISKDRAAKAAGSSHGPWRISRSPALCIAFPNEWFDHLGLIRLEDYART